MERKKMFVRLLTILVTAAMCLTISPQVSAEPADMIAIWHFDEGVGSVTADATSNGNDGMLTGGKFGNALTFDGVNDYVNIPDNPSLDITGDITLEGWIFINSFSTSSGLHMYIIGKDSAAQRSYGIGVDLSWTQPNKPFVILFHPGGSYKIAWGADELAINQWYHIAGVYDESEDDLTLFVNGIQQPSEVVTTSINPGTADLRIGARQYTDAECYFNGRIDEVRISDIARYDSSFPPQTSPFTTIDGNTVSLWHFDESIGSVVYDESSNNNDGTINGAVWAGPTWTTGYLGTGLHFDGLNDYVQVLDAAILEPETITVECYVKSTNPGIYAHILSKDYTTAFGASSYALYTGGSGGLIFYVKTTSGYVLSANAGSGVWDGAWHHVAGTFDGIYPKLFVDGVEILGPSGSAGDIMYTTPGNFLIGTYSEVQTHPSYDFCYSGDLDEICLWNTALSSEEVKRHAWGLVGEWLFETGSGSTALDTSCYGHDGTILGTPTWVSGKMGGALEFNGGTYVDLGADVDNLFDSEVTLEAWIYPHGKQNGGIISSDVTYNLPHKGFDFFLWNDDTYGRVYLDFGDGTTLGRMYYSIPSLDWYNYWHHVAGTWDGSDMKLYVDGVESTLSFTGTFADSERNNLIGAISSDSVLWQYDGLIDEVRIWNKALVPIVFDQTGLDSSADGKLVVEVSDPIPLNYEELPFVMMVPNENSVGYAFESIVAGGTGKQFSLVDVTGGDSPSDTAIAPTSIIGNYETQYYLTVETYPADLITFTEEGWHDAGTGVELTAPPLADYTFLYWDVDTVSQGDGVNPITVTMDSAHTATAHYFEWVTVSGHKYEDTDGTYPTTDPLEDWTMKLYSFCDNFEDGDDDGWERLSGTWSVIDDDGDKVYSGTAITDEQVSYALSAGRYADFTIEADLKAANSEGHYGLVLREDGAGHHYGFYLNAYPASQGKYYFGYWDGSAYHAIIPWTLTAAYSNANTWNTMKVVAHGYEFNLYINDILVSTVTDSNEYIDSGYVGLIIDRYSGSNQNTYFDDICIYDTAETDNDGFYEFTITKPATYTLVEELQEGWTQTWPVDERVILEIDEEDGGSTITNQDFWNFKQITISGHKYEYVFCDDFDSVNTNENPEGWTEYGDGTWLIEKDATAPSQGSTGYGDVYSGYASSTTYTRDFSFMTLASDFSDGVFEFSFKLYPGNPRITIPVRYQDDDDWILFDVDKSGLYRPEGYYIFVAHSGWTELGRKLSPITTDVWHTMKIVLEGWNYEMWIDGELVIEAVDTIEAFNSGSIGLGVYRDTHAAFDDVCLKRPLSDWDMYLCKDSTSDSTSTNSYGYYEFVIKEPGDYEIEEDLPEKWTKLYPGDIVYGDGSSVFGYGFSAESGVNSANNDFVNFAWFTLSGHKYFDGNSNGQWNNDEPYLNGWTITLERNGDPVASAITGLDWPTGYYDFTIKEPGTYRVSEEKSILLTQTEPTGTFHEFVAQSGVDVEQNFGNSFGGGYLTNSNLCYFDVDEADGQQFRVIFTPDITTDPSLYKISATNPGQFYYNVFYSGAIAIAEELVITLDEDFETQGATPVHVYSSLSVGPDGCLIPLNDISEDFTIVIDENEITVKPNAAYDGFVYITVHCDYALKQTGGYQLVYYLDIERVIRGDAIKSPDSESVNDRNEYEFSVDGPDSYYDNDIIENRNEFKKFRGIVGFLTNVDTEPIAGVDVIIKGRSIPGGIITVETDEDGFYGYSFFHTGKPAVYTVEFVGYETLPIILKAGHFVEVSYQDI